MTAAKNGSRTASTRAPRPSPAREPPARDGASLEDLVRNATSYVKELFASAKALIEIKAERKKLALRRTLIRVALGVVALIGVAAWLGAAVSATVRGLCDGLALAFGGRPWLGDLVGGLLALGLLAGGMALALRRSARKDLERLEAKYGAARNEGPPANAGGVPGSDGSRDAAADRGRDPAVR